MQARMYVWLYIAACLASLAIFWEDYSDQGVTIRSIREIGTAGLVFGAIPLAVAAGWNICERLIFKSNSIMPLIIGSIVLCFSTVRMWDNTAGAMPILPSSIAADIGHFDHIFRSDGCPVAVSFPDKPDPIEHLGTTGAGVSFNDMAFTAMCLSRDSFEPTPEDAHRVAATLGIKIQNTWPVQSPARENALMARGNIPENQKFPISEASIYLVKGRAAVFLVAMPHKYSPNKTVEDFLTQASH